MAAPAAPAAAQLAAFITAHTPVFVLTGAGVSTASGIPDYRDRDGRWKGAEPIRGQIFRGDERARRRYWSRSFVGWPRIAAARPNPAHLALAALEQAGLVQQILTQNVDGLHQRAGAQRVQDLHGRLDLVDCLACGRRLSREAMQQMLAAANPGVMPAGQAVSAPDGDALLDADDELGFTVPDCPDCGGLLKPAVVFFGENVPRARVAHAYARLDGAGALLVIGSSLTVFSGYRFCLHAAARDKPIALLNRGCTRADDLATMKVDADCGEVMAAVVAMLLDRPVDLHRPKRAGRGVE